MRAEQELTGAGEHDPHVGLRAAPVTQIGSVQRPDRGHRSGHVASLGWCGPGRSARPVEADRVTREAYTHEVISFGFWPGDDNIGDAAYYSYTAPEPDSLREQPLSAGAWVESGSGSLAILPYQAVRTASNPKTTVLAFCQSAYEAGARLAGWDTTSFESTWCPTPDQLQQLQANAGAEFGRTNDRVR